MGNFNQSVNTIFIYKLLNNDRDITWIHIPKDILKPNQNRNYCLVKFNSKQKLDKVFQQLQQQFANNPSALIDIVDNPYSPKQEKLIQKIYKEQTIHHS